MGSAGTRYGTGCALGAASMRYRREANGLHLEWDLMEAKQHQRRAASPENAGESAVLRVQVTWSVPKRLNEAKDGRCRH